jgi:hypothetical protein
LSSWRQEKAWFCQAFPNISLAVLSDFKGLRQENLLFSTNRISASFLRRVTLAAWVECGSASGNLRAMSFSVAEF